MMDRSTQKAQCFTKMLSVMVVVKLQFKELDTSAVFARTLTSVQHAKKEKDMSMLS